MPPEVQCKSGVAVIQYGVGKSKKAKKFIEEELSGFLGGKLLFAYSTRVFHQSASVGEDGVLS